MWYPLCSFQPNQLCWKRDPVKYPKIVSKTLYMKAIVKILNEKAACFPISCAAFHKINCLIAEITYKICKIVFISRIKHVPFYICFFNFIIFFFRLLQLLYQQNTIIVNMYLHSTFMISQITHAYTKTQKAEWVLQLYMTVS